MLISLGKKSLLLILCFHVVLFSAWGGMAAGADIMEATCEADGTCRSSDSFPGCEDEEEECAEWAKLGECEANPNYMLQKCQKSCGTCADSTAERNKKIRSLSKSNCVDSNEECDKWASQGECDANPNYMLSSCKKSCFVCADDDYESMLLDGSEFGVPQMVGDPAARKRIVRMKRYLEASDIDPKSLALCRNNHADCAQRATAGDCATDQICK